jgi:hypothetical protein
MERARETIHEFKQVSQLLTVETTILEYQKVLGEYHAKAMSIMDTLGYTVEHFQDSCPICHQDLRLVSNQNIDMEKVANHILYYHNSMIPLADVYKSTLNDYYERIVQLYDPMGPKVFNKWWRERSWLFNFDEHLFKSDYMFVFMRCINAYKTKGDLEVDGKLIQGDGSFNNFFWYALERHYSNEIKKMTAQKRNPSQTCPICFDRVQPLSTHLLKKHSDLSLDTIKSMGYTVDDFKSGCPLCPHHLPKPKIATTRINKIVSHLVSEHSSVVFDAFNEKYPGYELLDGHTKSVSEYRVEHEDGTEIDLIDMASSSQDVTMFRSVTDIQTKEAIESFLSMNMDEDEQLILDYIADEPKIKNIADGKLNHKKIGIPKRRFEKALASLQMKLSSVGFD